MSKTKPWNGSAAVDHLARVQQLLDDLRLNGYEPEVSRLMAAAVAAFEDQSNRRVRIACAKLVHLIHETYR